MSVRMIPLLCLISTIFKVYVSASPTPDDSTSKLPLPPLPASQQGKEFNSSADNGILYPPLPAEATDPAGLVLDGGPSLFAATSNHSSRIYDMGDPEQVKILEKELSQESQLNTYATLDCLCGRELGGGRIIGGTVAPRQGYYPWIVRLNTGCGGTVISDQWIVTAAHCVQGLTLESQLIAYFRQYRLDAYDQGEFGVRALRILWNFGGRYDPYTLNYDFALVQLSSPVPITGASKIRPACIAQQGYDFDGQTAIAQGWGVYVNGLNAQSPVLRMVNMAFLNKQRCQALGRVYVADTHTCTYAYGKSICRGDSGGPVTVRGRINGAHYLAGIVSGAYPAPGIPQPSCDLTKPQMNTQATLFTTYIQQFAFATSNICSE